MVNNYSSKPAHTLRLRQKIQVRRSAFHNRVAIIHQVTLLLEYFYHWFFPCSRFLLSLSIPVSSALLPTPSLDALTPPTLPLVSYFLPLWLPSSLSSSRYSDVSNSRNFYLSRRDDTAAAQLQARQAAHPAQPQLWRPSAPLAALAAHWFGLLFVLLLVFLKYNTNMMSFL